MKKKILILIITIILCFLLGILISFIIGIVDKNINEGNKTLQTTNTSSISNNASLLEFFNSKFNNGTKIGDNETICGMIDNVDENVLHINNLYTIRGNMSFQMKEFKEGYINIENISSFLINEKNEEIEKKELSLDRYIVVATGELVNNTNSNFLIPNETTLNIIPADTITIYNELNQMINNNKEIQNVEIQSASSEKIYCKYMREYNINGKIYSLPHIFSIETTDSTQWDNELLNGYEGKKVNIYFEKSIESIEVEYPIATKIELVK